MPRRSSAISSAWAPAIAGKCSTILVSCLILSSPHARTPRARQHPGARARRRPGWRCWAGWRWSRGTTRGRPWRTRPPARCWARWRGTAAAGGPPSGAPAATRLSATCSRCPSRGCTRGRRAMRRAPTSTACAMHRLGFWCSGTDVIATHGLRRGAPCHAARVASLPWSRRAYCHTI